MKLAVGMVVMDTRNAQLKRYQVVSFTEATVHVRHVVDGTGGYEIPVAEINKPADGWLRTDFDRCFERVSNYSTRRPECTGVHLPPYCDCWPKNKSEVRWFERGYDLVFEGTAEGHKTDVVIVTSHATGEQRIMSIRGGVWMIFEWDEFLPYNGTPS